MGAEVKGAWVTRSDETLRRCWWFRGFAWAVIDERARGEPLGDGNVAVGQDRPPYSLGPRSFGPRTLTDILALRCGRDTWERRAAALRDAVRAPHWCMVGGRGRHGGAAPHAGAT